MKTELTISTWMNLNALVDRMGAASVDEARQMRKLLLEAGYEGQTTADVPDGEWLAMLDEAVSLAAQA